MLNESTLVVLFTTDMYKDSSGLNAQNKRIFINLKQ